MLTEVGKAVNLMKICNLSTEDAAQIHKQHLDTPSELVEPSSEIVNATVIIKRIQRASRAEPIQSEAVFKIVRKKDGKLISLLVS